MKTKTNKYDSEGWPHGPHVYWYTNRGGRKTKIRQISYYVHGILEGYLKHYEEKDGSLKCVLGYTNGRPEGESVFCKY
jgi:antitoxin component YwqK of YwqJK toxin-antitoxin module